MCPITEGIKMHWHLWTWTFLCASKDMNHWEDELNIFYCAKNKKDITELPPFINSVFTSLFSNCFVVVISWLIWFMCISCMFYSFFYCLMALKNRNSFNIDFHVSFIVVVIRSSVIWFMYIYFVFSLIPNYLMAFI